MEQEQKVSEAKKAKDALFYQTEHAAKRVSPQELEASNAFAADYMAFLNVSKPSGKPFILQLRNWKSTASFRFSPAWR